MVCLLALSIPSRPVKQARALLIWKQRQLIVLLAGAELVEAETINGRGGEATHNVRERDVGVNEGGVVAAGLPLLEISVVVHGPKLA
jgi:hypothetical protein